MSEALASNGFDRVRAHGSEQANARIDRVTTASLARAAESPDYALRRMTELDREWDIDRALLPVFAIMGGVALALGLRKDRRWRFPLAAQTAFMLHQSFFGWSPPAMILRNLGFRTRQEIEAERNALERFLAGRVTHG